MSMHWWAAMVAVAVAWGCATSPQSGEYAWRHSRSTEAGTLPSFPGDSERSCWVQRKC